MSRVVSPPCAESSGRLTRIDRPCRRLMTKCFCVRILSRDSAAKERATLQSCLIVKTFIAFSSRFMERSFTNILKHLEQPSHPELPNTWDFLVLFNLVFLSYRLYSDAFLVSFIRSSQCPYIVTLQSPMQSQLITHLVRRSSIWILRTTSLVTTSPPIYLSADMRSFQHLI